MPLHDKIVLVTRKTALEELVERFNTRDQARFYLEHMGASFAEYEGAHAAYHAALGLLKESLPRVVRFQAIERAYLPNFLFGERDLVVTLGPDGLVVNTAKYLREQPLLALNPDPARIDGVLLPFTARRGARVLESVIEGAYRMRRVSMARADLNDGQSLHALNDLFIGQKTHVSARYRLAVGGVAEDQSSSGILVSTGAGSTGWFRSVLTGAAGVMDAFHPGPGRASEKLRESYQFDWEAPFLYYSVREPFISRTSGAGLVCGRIEPGEQMEIVSRMPQNGVIFSDGVEADYLEFNSGAIAQVRLAERALHLITAAGGAGPDETPPYSLEEGAR